MLDLIIENAHVVDYDSKINGIRNIGIKDGRIEELSEKNISQPAKSILDAQGLVAVPGIIDTHVHLSKAFGNGLGGCSMLAKAGVTTALEMAGPIDEVLDVAKNCGAGIQVALLEGIVPKLNIPDTNPSEEILEKSVESALNRGALGVKILGGHYPLTPEASQKLVAIANKMQSYISWHCGSTKTDNSIIALREFFQLTEGYPIHLAHINSYCRGLINSPVSEAAEALDLLEKAPKVFAESYIAATNGTKLNLDEQGKCASKATGQNLNFLGFEDSEKGMLAAIEAGCVHVFTNVGQEIVPISGKKGVALWLTNKGNVAGGMDINPADSRLALFLGKNKAQEFIVDALATDGGIIPRNVIVENALPLIESKALSWEDFVYKTSYKPAKWLQLENKGSLSFGKDADITLLDTKKNKAAATIVMGQLAMYQGLVFSKEATIITTEKGKKYVENKGLKTQLVALRQS